MATKEYNPRIKHVLKSYQNSAESGLHGPSSIVSSSEFVKEIMCSDSGGVGKSATSIAVHGYKKWLQNRLHFRHRNPPPGVAIPQQMTSRKGCRYTLTSSGTLMCWICVTPTCTPTRKVFRGGTLTCHLPIT